MNGPGYVPGPFMLFQPAPENPADSDRKLISDRKFGAVLPNKLASCEPSVI